MNTQIQTTAIVALILFSLFCASLSVCEAAVTLADTLITISGEIEGADADTFVSLAYGKKIEKVVFQESPGGSWRAGRRIGSWMQGRGITTVVEGVCASSCAMAFLGGAKRMFSPDAPRSVLIFHAPFLQTDNRTVETLKHAYFAWIERRTGKVIDERFKTAISSAVNPDGAVIFRAAANPDVIANGGITIICTGDEKVLPWGCKRTDSFSAKSLGFLTN